MKLDVRNDYVCRIFFHIFDSKTGIRGVGAEAVGKMSAVGIKYEDRLVASYSNGDTKVIGADCSYNIP